jgi:N-acetyl-1-D-myo-inositol-2-amino-2-deoxy-alpha-D-glucopyranoside deacetylase
MNARPLTLMAVHAHPDDEASMTGGVFAHYAAEGVRTVLVTCTDGRCGDGADGVKPDQPGHDPDAVVKLRLAELAEARAILGISDFEFLGYHDSGMDGWASNHAPGAFWGTPLEEATERVAALMREYRPDVVVTYDPNGFYGHPDHIQAHRATMAAIEQLGPDAPAKAYWTTMPHSVMEEFGKHLREMGADWEEAEDAPKLGLPDDEVSTWVDVRDVAEQKYRALAAHASQPDNKFFLDLGLEIFTDLMGTETFVRVRDTTGQPSTRETDLFAGLR